MTASPDDIARYTRDGLALTYQNDDLKAAQPRATDDGEIPTFFRYQADGQRFLTERMNLRGSIAPFHEAVEVEETLGIGTSISVAPNVPCARVIDETRNISVIARVRSASLDATIDRYSVELVG